MSQVRQSFYAKQTSLLRLKKTDRTVGTDQVIGYTCLTGVVPNKGNKRSTHWHVSWLTATRVWWNDQTFENTIANARTIVACSIICSRYKQPVGKTRFRPKSRPGSLYEWINKNCFGSLDTRTTQNLSNCAGYTLLICIDVWCRYQFYVCEYKEVYVCDSQMSKLCAFQSALCLGTSSKLTSQR